MATEAMSERPEDTDLVVVYEASPAVAAQVAELLTKEGIDCVITEKANPIASRYHSIRAHLASVAVPREDAPWARSYLRKWEQTCNANVGKLTEKLGVCFLRSTAITAAAHLCSRALHLECSYSFGCALGSGIYTSGQIEQGF